MHDPHHHPPADALLEYATGAATAGVELLVACHLGGCPTCLDLVERAEALGAPMLDRSTPEPPSAAALAAVLARLDEPAPVDPAPPRCPTLPGPLTRRVGPLRSVPWRAVGAGVRVCPIPVPTPGQRVFLMDFPPGFVIPEHTHGGGDERGLVLRGTFSDPSGTWARGDVSWRSADETHRVVIGAGERCTTLFVNDGPAELGGAVVTRLLDWWLGL